VHRGAGEVIVLADADDVWVFEFLIEKRVGVSSVPVVGDPGSRDGGGRIRGEGGQSAGDRKNKRRDESVDSLVKSKRAYWRQF
jgi:hypothetical protein